MGAHRPPSFNEARKFEIAGESLGSGLLVFLGCSASVATVVHNGSHVTQSAHMALYNKLGQAAAIFYAALCCFESSGAHINPAVTFSRCLRQQMGWRKGLEYVVAQLLGALGGALLHTGLVMIYAEDWEKPANVTHLLDNYHSPVSDHLPWTMLFLCEFLATTMFILGIDFIMSGTDPKPNKFTYACFVAFTFFIVEMAFGPMAGSLNPAWDLSTRVAASLRALMVEWTEGASAPWAHGYWVTVNLGSILAAFPASMIFRASAKQDPEEHR